ncbi:hypothetical protein NDU88_006705 [Pleurodeles waltl]|uniref:Uncharacterized protein n=1 Tax=Pleurodeles waltl TaxID=8319 RepID=A0AAV7NSM8_PLEWA|nr:hypothetical protein NDU88_006705 [Pleurodeles waltl]
MPPASRNRDRAASAGVRRGGGGTLSSVHSAHAVRVLRAPGAARLSDELRAEPNSAARTRRLGALGGSPVRFAGGEPCAAPRWLRRADSALTDPEPENARKHLRNRLLAFSV